MSKSNVEVNQQPIPEAALRDKDAVEMLRVWIAERRMHCSIKVGMYRETTNIPEEKAWGIIFADTARHIAHALESGYAVNLEESLMKIRDSFIKELDAPTSQATGEFARRQ